MNHVWRPGFIKMKIKNYGSQVWLLVYTLFLLLPALFINLGLMPFILDEGTRADVSMEMALIGNYIAPTINGEFYYNKPPLFNWLQMLSCKNYG